MVKLKKKLIDWYEENKENRKRHNFKEFNKMKLKSGEQLALYCCRLENSYKLAYPGHKDKRFLIQKFSESIPKSAKKLLKNYRMINKMNDKKITWKEVKRCAAIYDCEKEMSTDTENEIVVELGQQINKGNYPRPKFPTHYYYKNDKNKYDKNNNGKVMNSQFW